MLRPKPQNQKKDGDFMASETNKIELKVRVSEEEKKMIRDKMSLIPTSNFNSYAKKMLIDGYVIKHDFKELKAFTAELGKIGSNVNQIAKRANETRNVYPEDIKDVLKLLHELQILINDKVGKLIGD